MLKRFSFIVLLLISADSYCQKTELGRDTVISMDSLFAAKAKESIGKSFPAFNALFNGRVFTNDSLKGKIVFINFWFGACPPCVTELPYLSQLYKKLFTYKHFQFLTFSFDSPEQINLLKKRFRISYPVTSVSRQECYRLNQNNGFPTSIILDEKGIIKYLFTGGTTDKREARDFVEYKIHTALVAELVRLH